MALNYITKKSEKIKTIKNLLDERESVYAVILTQSEGLKIPSNFFANPTVTLELSLLFRGALFFLEEGIKVDLIFDVDYEECFIPWNSIVAVSPSSGNPDQYVFTESCLFDDDLGDNFDDKLDDKKECRCCEQKNEEQETKQKEKQLEKKKTSEKKAKDSKITTLKIYDKKEDKISKVSPKTSSKKESKESLKKCSIKKDSIKKDDIEKVSPSKNTKSKSKVIKVDFGSNK